MKVLVDALLRVWQSCFLIHRLKTKLLNVFIHNILSGLSQWYAIKIWLQCCSGVIFFQFWWSLLAYIWWNLWVMLIEACRYLALFMVGWSPCLWTLGYQILNSTSKPLQPAYKNSGFSLYKLVDWWKKLMNPPLYGVSLFKVKTPCFCLLLSKGHLLLMFVHLWSKFIRSLNRMLLLLLSKGHLLLMFGHFYKQFIIICIDIKVLLVQRQVLIGILVGATPLSYLCLPAKYMFDAGRTESFLLSICPLIAIILQPLLEVSS